MSKSLNSIISIIKDYFDVLRPAEEGTFEWALQRLKEGKHLRRAHWAEWGMYIWVMPAASIPVEHIREPHLKELCGDEPSIKAEACIRFFTHHQTVMSGWVPTQVDMFAADWEIAE